MSSPSPAAGAASQLTWLDGESAPMVCRVCGFAGRGKVVVRFETPGGWETARQCPECESLDLLSSNLPSSPDDESVDDYIEVLCGVGTIASIVDLALSMTSQGGSGRVLDVGCSYGVTLDYARWRTGWEAVGVEPSWAGVRGASDLGLTILAEPLTADTDLGGQTFDVILSSEVLEHVDQPLELLRVMASHLSPTGVLLLTTPDAALVRQGESDQDVIAALSPGYHLFLASDRGLAHLLREAGLESWAFTRTGVSHVAVARRGTLEPVAIGEIREPADVGDYLRERSQAMPAESPAGVGFAARALRTAVARGDLQLAKTLLPDLDRRLRATHGIGLEDAITSTAGSRGRGPYYGVLFSWGMIRLFDGSPREAAAAFEASLRAVEERREVFGSIDADAHALVWDAQFHLALALTQFEPNRAADAALAFPADRDSAHERLARVFVNLVNLGELDSADRLTTVVVEAVSGGHEARPTERITLLDALYALGSLSAQRSRGEEAVRWLELCVREAGDDPLDAHAAQLVNASNAILASLNSRDEG